MTIDTFLSLLQAGGAVGVLAFFVTAFLRGWIVPESTHKSIIDELRRDRDDWKEIALTGSNASVRAVSLLERRRIRGEK